MQSGRKRWNLHDGPQGSLRRLRNQLAEDGCAESQVVLAKQLLEEKCELEADKISNFKQALEWLICATEQGHPEARRMLRRCVRAGVVAEDSAPVARAKACLAAGRQETVARKAARDLFASLANGEQYITTAQLERRIREICANELRPDGEAGAGADDEQALEPSRPQAGDHRHANGSARAADRDDVDDEPPAGAERGRTLTVEHLVAAAEDYCRGALPPLSGRLSLSEPGERALDRVPPLQRALLHPRLFLRVLYLKLLLLAGALAPRLSAAELALALAAYAAAGAEGPGALLPLALYCASFCAMVVCTLRVLLARRRFVDFRKWSGLFLRYSDGSLRPEEAEERFVRNNLGPAARFFLALLANLLLAPLVPPRWVPFSELCVLSLCLALLTLAAFGADALALSSFALNVLAKYPYESDAALLRAWRLLELPAAGAEARALLSLLAPLPLLLLLRRGALRHALPHCVTLSWLQMFVACSHGSTAHGLARGALALACSLLFLPLLGAAAVALPALAALQAAPWSGAPLALAAAAALLAGLALTCLLAARDATKKFVTPVQLAVGAAALTYLAHRAALPERLGLPAELAEDKAPYEGARLDWDEYYAHCGAPAQAERGEAGAQEACAALAGARFVWTGAVRGVRVAGVRNPWARAAAWLPRPLAELLRCRYGRAYAAQCAAAPPDELAACEFFRDAARRAGRACHLDDLNEYTHEVTVDVEANGGLLKRHTEISLLLGPPFANFTRLLRADDELHFEGELSAEADEAGAPTLGARRLRVRPWAVRCGRCARARGGAQAPPAPPPAAAALRGGALSLRSVLNFVLDPAVVFKRSSDD